MSIEICDPFGAASDPELPALKLALDPAEADKRIKCQLPLFRESAGRLKAIRIIHYKPGRRCLVEYVFPATHANGRQPEISILGKLRARRDGQSGFLRLDAFWKRGFDSESTDGISVPEPLGVVPSFQMWFQRRAPGVTATRLLPGPDGAALARRIAEAIHKVHRAKVPTVRSHTMADELRILRECLAKVAALQPAWATRLERLQAACEQLGASCPPPKPCGIHRDFYADQVIVDGERLCLIDFDLYCAGDPGLDIGNFIAHITEHALREQGRADALTNVERALEERFLELSGGRHRASIHAYTTLTLVRHIYLSTCFEERRHLTAPLLELCERRLGVQCRG
jgi:Phosphotransferase enzyme family